MAYSGSQRTRLGLAAIPRGLYGSFEGKSSAVAPSPAPEPITPSSAGAAGWPSRYDIRKKKERQDILNDDEEVIRLVSLALTEILKKR